MARRPNYGFQKQQKELKKQKKREQKEEKKKLKAEEGESVIPPQLDSSDEGIQVG